MGRLSTWNPFPDEFSVGRFCLFLSLISTITDNVLYIFHVRIKMALQCQHFYFLGVLLFGLSLTMVMTFRSTNINSISVIDSGQNQTSNQNKTTSQPSKQLVEEQVSYPWIGDPTCQHFPVQV
jgi:hypothetical protein